MSVIAAGCANAEGMIIPFRGRFLPLVSPTRGAGWHRSRLDRPAVRRASRNPGSAEKTEAGVIEIVAIEIVNIHAERRACRHEWIDDLIVEEHRDVVAAHLV